MSNKTDWIKSQLLPDDDASEATGRLNTTYEIDNPTPRPDIPTPIDIDKMWDLVPPGEIFKVLNTLIWDRVIRAIEAKNKALVGKYITALVAGGCLAPATAGKIAQALSGTIPDPNWQPKITTTLARSAGFDAVRVDEVQDVLDAK
jgi:hypothetical protein